jgi:sporulation protein YlmC with PRC-barrel domain
MKTIPFLKLAGLGVFQLTAAAMLAAAEPNVRTRPVVQLDDFLWREVQNVEGVTLGSVSDVLVHLPTGRIVFVSVHPTELFGRPKALPPDAIAFGESPNATLRVDLSEERWRETPELEWNAARVIKHGTDGPQVVGYYQQQWAKPAPEAAAEGDENAVVAAPTEPGTGEAEQYVSLSELVLDRVLTPATEQPGFVRDFVLDWSAGRATYALISSTFTPTPEPEETWFAIPTALLAPPLETEAITVLSNEETFRSAQQAPEIAALPEENRTQIYLYPATADEEVTNVAAADAEPETPNEQEARPTE